MTRWRIGDPLTGETDQPIPSDLEIRTETGGYWQRCGGTWESLTGAPTSVSAERLYGPERPAIVTYVPPTPAPHTRPGNYVCSCSCAYRVLKGL